MNPDRSVQRVVFASTSGAIYGEQQRSSAVEEHPQHPVSPYGLSKLATERYPDYYHTRYALSCVSLRYANVYEPRQNPRGEAGVVAVFCDDLASRQASTINGTEETDPRLRLRRRCRPRQRQGLLRRSLVRRLQHRDW